MNVPNYLTLLRIILMPILVYFFSIKPSEPNNFATCIVIIACLTDFLDGWIARRFDQKSVLGMIFDPIADKLMLSVVLILLTKRYTSFALPIITMLLLSREFIVAGIREALAILTRKATLPVSILGKIKTTLQMISIIILVVYNTTMPIFVYEVGFYMLCFATLLSMYSMFTYMKKCFVVIDR